MFKLATAIMSLLVFACIAGATDCPVQQIRVQQVVEYQPIVQEVRVQRVVQQVQVQRVQQVQVQRQFNVQRNVFVRPQVQRSFSFQRSVIR